MRKLFCKMAGCVVLCFMFCNYSVIVFCDHEIFRPVRDDMLVENDVTNFPRPVGMLCW
jgi:hypothetical protein